MEPVFDPFEVLSIFAEVIVGQLGFQVVAVAVGRSGESGRWHSGDTRLFFAMIACGAEGQGVCLRARTLVSAAPDARSRRTRPRPLNGHTMRTHQHDASWPLYVTLLVRWSRRVGALSPPQQLS